MWARVAGSARPATKAPVRSEARKPGTTSDNTSTEQPGRMQPAGSTMEPARSQRSERSDKTGDDERQSADGTIAITFTWSTSLPATKFLVGAKRRNQERGANSGPTDKDPKGQPSKTRPGGLGRGLPRREKFTPGR